MGELKDENGEKLPALTLGDAQYLPSLKGKKWASDKKDDEIGDDIQKFFRQEKIDVKILLRDSDEHAKYELFQRINTGGTPLSDQEVRNCIMIMINREAYFWIEGLSKNSDFNTCCPIPDRLSLERYDIELVLRFSILFNIPLARISEVPDLSQFLTTEMRSQFAEGAPNLPAIGSVFERVFLALNNACGDNALRRYDAGKAKFSGPFLISAFELVALGVAANIDFVEQHDSAWLERKVKAIWSDNRADGIYGQGVSTARRLPRTLALGREFFAEA